MNKVDTLRRIASMVADTRIALVGPTGYLDGPVEPTASVMKGVDNHGRVFITLCIKATSSDDRTRYESGGVITVFQRYTEEDVVTQANNSDCPPPLFLSGAATAEDMKKLEELVTTGKTTLVATAVVGGTFYGKYELASPKVALSYRSAMMSVSGTWPRGSA